MSKSLHCGVEGESSPHRCSREGCERPKRSEGYCSSLCRQIDDRLTETLALIADKGISPAAAALWAAAVSLSDQLSEVDRLDSLLRSEQAVG